MTGLVSPLEMPRLQDDGGIGLRQRVAGRPMTLAAVPQPAPGSLAFDVSTVDSNGRVVARTALKALGWKPGDRLNMTPVAGLIVVTADPSGRRTITGQGILRLPVGLQSLCGLGAGVRVLIASQEESSRLIVYPPGVLDELLAKHHADTLGGQA